MTLEDLITYSQENKAEFRAELVETAFDIFRSFEIQFSRVFPDCGPKDALHMLAKDATDRAMKYMRNTESTTRNSISEAVILGVSKIQPVMNIPIPSHHIMTPGCDIKYKYKSCEMDWSTASLYEKSGIVQKEYCKKKDQKNGIVEMKYYKKKDGKTKTSKYGYRLPLANEDWTKLKEHYISDNITEAKSGQFADCEYFLPPVSSEEGSLHTRQLLDDLNSMDKSLSEARTKEIIVEVKNILLDQIKNLKCLFQDQQEQERTLLATIEKNLETIKTDEYFDLIMQNLEDTKRDIVRCMQKGQEENKRGFERIEKRVEDLAGGVTQINQKLDSTSEAEKRVKRPVWFKVQKTPRLFAGRNKELNAVHEAMQRCKDGTVVSQMTVVHGLGGIGKTELCRQYAKEYAEMDYDGNAVWIEAETEEKLRESFEDLAKDALHISLKDTDRQKKSLRAVVEEVYRYFAEDKSLFVFNNAENIDGLKSFLPIDCLSPNSNMPCFLISSRNKKWEAGIKDILLEGLELEDAMWLIKKGLNIPDDDESQSQEIRNLAQKLQCFPLALTQAIAYILCQAETEEFEIRHYLEKYEDMAEEYLNFEGFKGIDNTYDKTTYTTWKITWDKIAMDASYGSAALKILCYMAYLSSDIINRDMLCVAVGSNQKMLNSSVSLLVKYSLVNDCRKQSVLFIHRLVQEVIRIFLKENKRAEEILSELMDVMICQDMKYYKLPFEVTTSLSKLLSFPFFIETSYGHAKLIKGYAMKHNDLKLKAVYFINIMDEIHSLPSYEPVFPENPNNFATFGYKMSMLVRRFLGSRYFDEISKILSISSDHHQRLEMLEVLNIFENEAKHTLDNAHFSAEASDRAPPLCTEHRKHTKALELYREAQARTGANTIHDTLDALLTLQVIAFKLTRERKYCEAAGIYEAIYKKSLRIPTSEGSIFSILCFIISLYKEVEYGDFALRICLRVLQTELKKPSTDYTREHTVGITIDTIIILLKLRRYVDAVKVTVKLVKSKGHFCHPLLQSLIKEVQVILMHKERTENDDEGHKLYEEVFLSVIRSSENMKRFLSYFSSTLQSNDSEEMLANIPLPSYDCSCDAFKERCAYRDITADHSRMAETPKYPYMLTATSCFFNLLKTGAIEQEPEQGHFATPENQREVDIKLKYGLHLLDLLKHTLGEAYGDALIAVKQLASCTEFNKILKDVL